MVVTDDYCIYLLCDKRQLNIKRVNKYLDKSSEYYNEDLSKYISTRYTDSISLRETIFRMKYKIEIRPVCPICGNPVIFCGKNTKIFETYCSRKCAQTDKQVRLKRYNTSVKKYGYGCNIEKTKQTCLERYGVDNFRKRPDLMKQKYINKFGVDNPSKVKEIKLKGTLKFMTPDVQQKRVQTMKEHGTINTSNTEDKSFVLLKEKYSDVIRQYTDNRYSFNCDFYIPSLDLFIECNFHWTHGGKPFEGTDDDLQKIQKWCDANTEYYDNAVTTWCIRDVNKRNTAKHNNLNYIEFWNINDVNKFIQD